MINVWLRYDNHTPAAGNTYGRTCEDGQLTDSAWRRNIDLHYIIVHIYYLCLTIRVRQDIGGLRWPHHHRDVSQTLF